MNLQKVVDQDPLAQLYEEDKSLIWEMRYTGWLVMSSIYYKLVVACTFEGWELNHCMCYEIPLKPLK